MQNPHTHRYNNHRQTYQQYQIKITANKIIKSVTNSPTTKPIVAE